MSGTNRFVQQELDLNMGVNEAAFKAGDAILPHSPPPAWLKSR